MVKNPPARAGDTRARGLISANCVRLLATPWTGALQAPLSMGFSRQEYWSGLSFPPPGDLPNPGIEPVSPVSPAWAGRLFTTEPPGKSMGWQRVCHN